MPTVIASINGYETPLDFDDNQLSVLSSVSVSGNVDDYTIEYGNNLVEMGGVVTVTTTVEKDGYREAATQITLPFEILDAHATALNITESVNTVYGENAFIRIDGNKLGIYGSFIGTRHKEMKIKWTAKGYVPFVEPETLTHETEVEDTE